MSITEFDRLARERAIDPKHSFLVQAPAGSGKTELLTQRYLALLTKVSAPEEIIAITFTRKAAAEMRARILSSFELVTRDFAEIAEHQRTTFHLAKEVLRRDQELHWNLTENPNRLRILTIDALCAYLSSQMPILSRIDVRPRISEDPTRYYQQAIESLLTHLDKHSDLTASLQELLIHLENKVSQLSQLLITLLQKRDQWLGHIIHTENSKESIQQGLVNIILEKQRNAKKILLMTIGDRLVHLAKTAGQFLQIEKPSHPLAACADLTELPDVNVHAQNQWLGIAQMLLTQEGNWRAAVDRRIGFLPKTDAKKEMEALLNSLLDCEELRSALIEILGCPPLEYSAAHWKIVAALITILPTLAAELNVIFQENGVIDFVELNLAANRSLGNQDEPTNLALHLDYSIKHLLIDEFQDTSITQFSLLEKLVADWHEGDGRTVFLVGDPMQSIYRFRNAEVGLFLRTKELGIRNLKPQFLTLYLNFRSQAAVVEWVNDTFETIFPSIPSIETGAVPFTSAKAHKEGADGKIHCYWAQDKENEAEQILGIINHCRQQNGLASIAILVRSRRHLSALLPLLKEAEIPFQAIEIDPLQQRLEIRDLVSLTKALLNFSDHVAWLSLLRAPWCGLTLHDFYSIEQRTRYQTIWQVVSNYQHMNEFSPDTKLRLDRFIPILANAINNRGRLPLAEWIYGVWIALGGPACLESENDFKNIHNYFELLRKVEAENPERFINLLEEKLLKFYSISESSAANPIQIMTIHKAKGLEFDHVIIPGLGHRPPSNKNEILLWLERPNLQGSSDLILVPIKAADQKSDSLYQYLRNLENTKLHLESARLLYVAVTRAKNTLHLLGELSLDDEGLVKPPEKGTFLQMLWSSVAPLFLQQKPVLDRSNTEQRNKKNPVLLERLQADWKLPLLESGLNPQVAIQLNQKSHLLKCAIGDHSRLIGIVIHDALQKIADHSLKYNSDDDKTYALKCWENHFIKLGVGLNNLAHCLSMVSQAVEHTLQDERGKWILTNHPNAQNEYPLTMTTEGLIQHFIVDRTFVTHDGIRWIIDYKTTTPGEGPLSDFLAQQQVMHRDQLNQYANAFRYLHQQPIKLGLYFPLCGAWSEWEYK